MNLDYKAFLIGLAIGAIITFFVKKQRVKEIQVPFKVEVQVPVVEKEFDTIYTPVPEYTAITVYDDELLEEYKKANDSLKNELFKSAVTVRNYEEVFEDSIQTITVGANVTGTLNSLSAKYKTKPRTVTLDTTLTVEVPDYSRSVSLYGEMGMPTNKGVVDPVPVFKAGLDFSNKKNWVIGGSYDTEKRVWIKVGKKFNF